MGFRNCCADEKVQDHDRKAEITSQGSSQGNLNQERETWGHTAEFLLSTVGYAVGLGNLWRFPYLCYRNGGGAFLIPYFLFLFLCGIPLVFLEMSIGQFAAAGPLCIWSIFPLGKGLGFAMVMVSIYCCIYYNVIIMWTLYYLFNSFFKVLPWASCDNEWNTPDCTQLGMAKNGSVVFNSSWPLCSEVNLTQLNMTDYSSVVCRNRTKRPPYPAEEFWDRKVLARSSGISDLGLLRWDLSLTLLLAWVVVFACLIKGIKSSGKVVYVTAVAPYIFLTILLIQNATMEGSLDGIKFYITPNFTKLAKPSVWAEACGQIFFSLGPGWGGLITMASYNKFNTNVYRFSIAVPLINCLTSLYAGFVIFSVLGYMAGLAQVPVDEIVDSAGPGIIFVAYPYAISNLPIPQLWSVLFFLMVLTIGLDSQFGMFETFTTSIFDELPHIFKTRLRKMAFTGSLIATSYIIGLLYCTNAGVYFFQLMDWYIAIFSLLFVAGLECLVISWGYGVDHLYEDIELMIGYQPNFIWKWMWRVVTPLIVTIMMFYSLATYSAPLYAKTYQYPAAAIGLAWLYGVSSSLPVPGYIIYLMVKTRNEGLSIVERLVKYSKPCPRWIRKRQQKYAQSGVEMSSNGTALRSANGSCDNQERKH